MTRIPRPGWASLWLLAVLAIGVAGVACSDSPTAPSIDPGVQPGASLGALTLDTGATTVAALRGGGNCLGGGALKDESGPFTLTAAAGSVIDQVSVKAGPNCLLFIEDGTDGCYTVSGIGTATVTVTGGGTGPNCKAISHIEATTTPGEPPCTIECEPPPCTIECEPPPCTEECEP